MNILKIITRLQGKRRDRKITPDHVPEAELMTAIHAEARKELNDLYKEDKIGIVQTLNELAVYVKEDNQKKE